MPLRGTGLRAMSAKTAGELRRLQTSTPGPSNETSNAAREPTANQPWGPRRTREFLTVCQRPPGPKYGSTGPRAHQRACPCSYARQPFRGHYLGDPTADAYAELVEDSCGVEVDDGLQRATRFLQRCKHPRTPGKWVSRRDGAKRSLFKECAPRSSARPKKGLQSAKHKGIEGGSRSPKQPPKV